MIHPEVVLKRFPTGNLFLRARCLGYRSNQFGIFLFFPESFFYFPYYRQRTFVGTGFVEIVIFAGNHRFADCHFEAVVEIEIKRTRFGLLS